MQAIDLPPGLNTIGSIMHKMFHTLGRYHEHMRSDRDSYVIIYPENIARSEGIHLQCVYLRSRIIPKSLSSPVLKHYSFLHTYQKILPMPMSSEKETSFVLSMNLV